jgi:hypothetical protein
VNAGTSRHCVPEAVAFVLLEEPAHYEGSGRSERKVTANKQPGQHDDGCHDSYDAANLGGNLTFRKDLAAIFTVGQ